MRATASALSELASLYGIQACYAGADGSTQIADTEVVVALLRSCLLYTSRCV